uniref:Putative toll-like receptor n=1 Tax=Culex tarsalis TaxID=7177 RepID=A0A1Q3FIA5_CULTA
MQDLNYLLTAILWIIIPTILANGIIHSGILTIDEPITHPEMYLKFPQLWQLDMSNQTSFEFPKDRVLLIHNKLARYFCNNCSVHSIYKRSFAMLPQLTHLELDHNNLSYIHPDAFENNPLLQRVQLVGNNLVNFNPEGILRHVNFLSILNLDQNTGFDINQVQIELSWLIYFSCRNCNTSFVDKSTMGRWQRLGHLHLANNQIESIDQDAFLAMSRFKHLNVKGNKKLTKVSFVSKTLLHLDAEDCGLEGILDTAGLPALEIINVRKNRISKIHERAFQHSENIKRIVLDDNEIEKIPEKLLELPLYNLEALCIDRNPLQPREILGSFIAKYSSKKLRRGCMDDENHLKQFELNLPSKNGVALYTKFVNQLKFDGNTADFSFQNIIYIVEDFFENDSAITKVILDNNKDYDFPSYHAFLRSNFIMEVSFENCAITSIHDKTLNLLPNIRSINLKGNRIKSLDSSKVFQNNTKLEHLNLAFNELKFVAPNAFQELQALRSVNLSNNEQLTTELGISFLISVYLEILICSFCQFYQIDEFTLSGLTNIKELDLSYNKVTTVHENAFRWTKKLQHLDLEHNHLHTFEPDLIQFGHLQTFCLAGNEEFDFHLPKSQMLEDNASKMIKLEINCKEKMFASKSQTIKMNLAPKTASIVRDKNLVNLGALNYLVNIYLIALCILLNKYFNF